MAEDKDSGVEEKLAEPVLRSLRNLYQYCDTGNPDHHNIVRAIDELIELRWSVTTLKGVNETLLRNYHKLCSELQKARAEVGRLYTMSSRQKTDIEALTEENEALKAENRAMRGRVVYARHSSACDCPCHHDDSVKHDGAPTPKNEFEVVREDRIEAYKEIGELTAKLDACRIIAERDIPTGFEFDGGFENGTELSDAVKAVRSLKRRHDELGREVERLTKERDGFRSVADNLRELVQKITDNLSSYVHPRFP
jgi:uncharacterized coiled-coil DUF342 family protein